MAATAVRLRVEIMRAHAGDRTRTQSAHAIRFEIAVDCVAAMLAIRKCTQSSARYAETRETEWYGYGGYA